MKRSNWLIILGTMFVWCTVGIILVCFLSTKPSSIHSNDEIIEINQIRQELVIHEKQLSELDSMPFTLKFTVFDLQGDAIYHYGGTKTPNVADAIRNGDLIFPLDDVHSEGWMLGVVSESGEAIKKAAMKSALVIWACTGFLLFAGAIAVIYIRNNILKPFDDMKEFAASIASGNLDTPLTMGKRKYFGAFTESFDIMREELNRAKEQEYLANVSKKELVASLSHDIKTPVTSIKLMCEVLDAKLTRNETNPKEIAEKLDLILAKAGQIDTLISDMFQSTLEDLGELKVHLLEVESSCLMSMFRHADYYDKITEYANAPACLLYVDPVRLEQIIGNVINNSYKYAQTKICVTYSLEKVFLRMTVKDFGAGIPDEEIPHIFQKFYRGKNTNATQTPGAGLGLYICRSLMNLMNGQIECRNCSDGFEVELCIPLA